MLYVRNSQVAHPVVGAATDKNRVVYLSLGGFKTSLRSLWATLVAPKKALQGSLGRLNRRDAGYVKPLYSPVPESAMTRMTLLAKEADLSQAATWRSLSGWDGVCFLVAMDPRAVKLKRYDYDERAALHHAHVPELQARLARVLDAYHPFPVQPAWGAYLWDEATRTWPRLLDDTKTYGECICGYQVRLESDNWLEFIQEGLQRGTIAIQPPSN